MYDVTKVSFINLMELEMSINVIKAGVENW